MYLLKPGGYEGRKSVNRALHSTMYLLKLVVTSKDILTLSCAFTFHYVSIKTRYLLVNMIEYVVFTFHYVSIKTRYLLVTMIEDVVFTFHYVSIKTDIGGGGGSGGSSFTFHYVSIKTRYKFIKYNPISNFTFH